MINYASQLQELEKKLSNPDVASDRKEFARISREYNHIKSIVELETQLEETNNALEDAKKELSSDDAELQELAQSEVARLQQEQTRKAEQLKVALLPPDPLDEKNIIMEIRGGAGGDEAALFAANLFRMYTRYAETQGWKTEILSTSQIGIGGYKEIIFSIHGTNVFSHMKYESGVHRVQRIPETEKSGRVHTSTATVAVLPEAEEVDIEIKQEELRVDVFRSGGNGGQSVNTTDSAVRITHVPTGMVVTCQDEKSQHKNRDKAMKVLRSRMMAEREEDAHAERAEARLSQVGSGDRSEKIRTYNIPQDRITDHRIKQNWSSVHEILDGKLGQIIEQLQAEDQKVQLANLAA